MMKKIYSTPEVEIEIYTVDVSVMTASSGLEGTGGEFVVGDDWEF